MDQHLENLINVLQTGDEWDAADASVSLGRLRATQAVPALILALHSKDALKDWNALDKMTRIAFGGVGEGLVAINALRCAAAHALGEIGDEKAIPELLAVLNSKKSDDLDIHDAVAKALSNFAT